jgi:hypothetical protein
VSSIRVAVGTAVVELDAVDRQQAAGTFPSYSPRDLVDATASALLAVNTPDAVRWAHALYELTALNLGVRRGPTPDPRQEP